MAGAFELMAKTGNFTELSRTMAATAAQLAKAKADADKQARKAEQDAMAKVDDFIIKDKRKYTEKFQPVAKQAMMDLITQVQDDKVKYPNTWTNMVTSRIVETEGKLVTALEQSEIQREVQSKAAEGYMIPQELIAAYNTKPGEKDNIIAVRDIAARYGIEIAEDGTVGKPSNISKPIDMLKAVEDVRTQKGGYVTTEVGKVDGKTYTVTTKSKMLPEELVRVKDEFSANRDLRRMYQVDNDKFERIKTKADELKTANPQLNDVQAREQAITDIIKEDIDKINFDLEKQDAQRIADGIRIYNQAARPGFIGLAESTFTGQAFPDNPNELRPGVNLDLIWQKQGSPDGKITTLVTLADTLINPSTGKPIDDTAKKKIFQGNATLGRAFRKDNKVFVEINLPFPLSGLTDVDVNGKSTFYYEITPSGSVAKKLDAIVGRDALKEAGVSSMYNYIKNLPAAGAGGDRSFDPDSD